jgi:hypothetical protein
MRKVVGISQKIKRGWLDAVLDRLVKTTDKAELRAFLDKHLEEELPGTESRAKSSGIVLRIWSGSPAERIDQRNRAISMLSRISGRERIWLHWGMTALAYPFFRDTAEVVGRLLTLQDDFTTAQVQGRMLTTWGDRATSKDAVQKLITSLVDWEVLRSTKTKGHFLLARKITASNTDVQLWLLEALLGASATDEIEAQQLLRLPESFPFKLTVGVADLRRHEGFNIYRQGLDIDMVSLRKVKLQPPPKLSKKAKKENPTQALHPSLFDIEPEKVGSNESKPNVVSLVPITMRAVEDHSGGADDRRIEQPIKGQRIPEPAGRLFTAPSAECVQLLGSGHYFGCIALAQVLLEAVIRHVSQIKLMKKPNHDRSFTKDLEALHKKKFITDDLKVKLDQIWADQQSFRYLRPSVECDQRKLKESACNLLKLLDGLEREFFGCGM